MARYSIYLAQDITVIILLYPQKSYKKHFLLGLKELYKEA